jgi:RES domain-containing protein
LTPLPDILSGKAAPLTAWRLDRDRHASTWQNGEGAFQAGGRWNPQGVRVVYASLDPATAIIEVAVHKGFKVLDTQPHILTRFVIAKPEKVKVFAPDKLPKRSWLDPNNQSSDKKAWGGKQIAKHGAIIVPSAVSRNSWNLILSAPLGDDWFGDIHQEPFVIDPRLHTQ